MVDSENIVWGVDLEVNLLHAMRGHKPVGVNRYFQLALIHEKLNNISQKKITAGQIWKHLGVMYDLHALNESEILPFPNKETDFSLPEDDYKEFLHKAFPRSPTKNDENKTEQKTEKETHSNSSLKTSKTDKSESKHFENKHTSNVVHANTPENSPKRKRTRHTPSSQPSPANTPDTPATKRRR
ncbi:MRGBP [Mytilus coruscus]|uniref:MRGBP n=1 Tax=Mytilus coruscus TaxID=42192 RepID=A0A6J8B1A7_MYTCO|nr:MRGBP [Mytilus coruscus]